MYRNLGSLEERPQTLDKYNPDRSSTINVFNFAILQLSHLPAFFAPISMPYIRLSVLCVLHALQALDDEPEEQAALAFSSPLDANILSTALIDKRHGQRGRTWKHFRNNQFWFFNYALQPSFLSSGSWMSLFGIPCILFRRILHELRPHIIKTPTNFREPLPPELRLAAFLMYSGGATCEAVASQLGIGPSTVSIAVKEVSQQICATYIHQLQLPMSEEEIAKVMDGFERIRGLPYCVGAVDGTHIPWPACPEDQYYEYRCYKGFTSVVIFAVVSADRRFLYADVGRPGVLGDSIIYSLSSLQKKIETEIWPGPHLPHLKIGDVFVKPYLMGDCAFTLDVHMMKSSSKAEIKANPVLQTWDSIASQTRKPVEHAFGMLKNRFTVLKVGVKLHHEDNISYLCLASLLLYNLCIDVGDNVEHYLPQDEDVQNEVISAETNAGKKQRDALFYYAIEKLGTQ